RLGSGDHGGRGTKWSGSPVCGQYGRAGDGSCGCGFADPQMTAQADRQTPPPVTTAGSYRPPLWLRSGHVQTVWPSLFRRLELPLPDEERIDTPDGDFLDLDWYRAGHPRVAVLCHGLEGNSRRPYMQGMARALLHAGWDVLCWNFRSC